MHLTSGVENHPGLQRKFCSSFCSSGQKFLSTIEKVHADKTIGCVCIYIYTHIYIYGVSALIFFEQIPKSVITRLCSGSILFVCFVEETS